MVGKDETVILTLLNRRDYVPKGQGPVTGVILNDDFIVNSYSEVIQNYIGDIGNNVLFGNSLDNTLDGKEGGDMITGFGGRDKFLFSTTPLFGYARADIITDFDPYGERDRLVISKTAFGIDAATSRSSLNCLSTAASVKDLEGAARSTSLFIYNPNDCFLYYNANGTAEGWGTGGPFAMVLNWSSVNYSNLDLMLDQHNARFGYYPFSPLNDSKFIELIA